MIDERGRRINERKKAKTAPKSIVEAYGERVAANLEKERPNPKKQQQEQAEENEKYFDKLLNEKFDILSSKKAIKVTKSEWASVNSKRTERYGDVSEDDIPTLDYFEVGTYNEVNQGHVYIIRNSGKTDFVIISKRKLRQAERGTKNGTTSNSQTERVGTPRRPNKSGDEGSVREGGTIQGDAFISGNKAGSNKRGNTDNGNDSSRRTVKEALSDVIDRLNNDEDVSNEELESLPQIRELLDEVAKRPETYTINTPERRTIRKKVLKKLLSLGSAQVDSKGKIVYNGEVKQERRADIVIGLSAAGKSSVFVDPLSYTYSSRVIDSDMAKEELPEFDNGMGANAVHRESQDIIDDLLELATYKGDNIVWPVVGGNDVQSTIEKINYLKENGYTVYLHLNELSNNKAVGRSLNRYIETGRFIPPAIIKKYGDTPTQNFNKIINTEGLVDGYSHYSNDVARGEEPRLIEISENVREFDERRREFGEAQKEKRSSQKTTESKQVETDSIDGSVSSLPENTNAVSKPIEQYSKEWQQVIKGYLSATSKRLMRLIEVIKGGNTKFMRQKICDVSARAAKDIKALLGIDVTGYTHDINTNGVTVRTVHTIAQWLTMKILPVLVGCLKIMIPWKCCMRRVNKQKVRNFEMKTIIQPLKSAILKK